MGSSSSLVSAGSRLEIPAKLPPRPVYAVKVARALERAQAARLGIGPESGLGVKELIAGRQAHPSVSPEQLNAVSTAYSAAQRDFLRERRKLPPNGGTKILMAPTSRVVDYSVNADGVQRLITDLVSQGRQQALKDAIADGPDSGFLWEKADDPVQVIASIVRWVAKHGRDKVRLTATAPVREWIHSVLNASYGDDRPLRPRIGGISAANSLHGRALKDDVTMMALGAMPRNVAELLPKDIRVVSDDPHMTKLGDLPAEGESAGHFALLADGAGDNLLPESLAAVTVNGGEFAREHFTACDVLITGSSSVRGFGSLSLERTRELGKCNDVVILTGAQYIKDSTSCIEFLQHVAALHASGASVALSYTEAKSKSIEFENWARIKDARVVDLLSLNAGEAYQFIKRLGDDRMAALQLGLTPDLQARVRAVVIAGAREDADPWENGHEDPAWVASAAKLLQSCLDIPIVRVRGKVADVTVSAAHAVESNRKRIVHDLIQSRVMGVLKTANPKGLLTEFTDLAFLHNIPNGKALAGLHVIADQLARDGAQADAATLPVRMVCDLPDGRLLFAVPPLEMYVKDGGTASAGDLIDYTFASQQANGLLKAAHQLQQLRRKAVNGSARRSGPA